MNPTLLNWLAGGGLVIILSAILKFIVDYRNTRTAGYKNDAEVETLRVDGNSKIINNLVAENTRLVVRANTAETRADGVESELDELRAEMRRMKEEFERELHAFRSEVQELKIGITGFEDCRQHPLLRALSDSVST